MIIQHCDLLDRGMTEWENWREEFPEQTPILNWIVRPEAELRYFDLSSASMCGANFEGSDFEKSDCAGSDFCGAMLRGSNFANTNCEGASFKGCNLEGANFRGANLKGASFFGASLKGCDFREASLDGVDFTGAILTEAHFEGTTMMAVNMSYADMSNAELASDKSPMRVKHTVFEGVDLGNANLEGANLIGVIFQSVNFSEASLLRVSLGKTVFADCNLSGAIGLNEVDHIQPSTLGLDTLLKSEGDIPESFMIDAGVPEAFVEILTGNQAEAQAPEVEQNELATEFASQLGDTPVIEEQVIEEQIVEETQVEVTEHAAPTIGDGQLESQLDAQLQEETVENEAPVAAESSDEQIALLSDATTEEIAEEETVQAVAEQTETEEATADEQGVEVSEPTWPFAEQDDSGLAQALADAEQEAEEAAATEDALGNHAEDNLDTSLTEDAAGEEVFQEISLNGRDINEERSAQRENAQNESERVESATSDVESAVTP